MKKSTRILSAILMVLMLVSVFNGFVIADGTDTATVTTSQELIDAIGNSNIKTIKLGNNIPLNENVTYSYDSENAQIIVKNGDTEPAKLNAKTLGIVEGGGVS